MARNGKTIHGLVLFLVAMLAWPWSLALSSLENSHQAPGDGSSVRAKRSTPGKRVARAARWGAQASPALLEEDEESGEENDGLGTTAPFFFVVHQSVGPIACLASPRPIFPSDGRHSQPMARLCCFRC